MKKQITLLTGFLILSFVCLIGCSDLGEENKSPSISAPSDTVKWSDISGILNSNCAVCHGADNTSDYFNASSYTSTMNHQTGSGNNLVVAGNADNSELIWRLEGSNGLPQMPEGMDPLSESQISLIKSWINDGALE